MAQYAAVLDEVFQALADPTRRAVLHRLGEGPATVGELAEPFEMALTSFMKHIRALERSGCIATRKVGRSRVCTLRPDTVSAAEAWLRDERSLWEARIDRLEAFLLAEETVVLAAEAESNTTRSDPGKDD